MYISPFAAGVLVTIGVEFIILIVAAAITMKKKK